MERLRNSVGVFLVAMVLLGHAAGASLKTLSRSDLENEVSSSYLSESENVDSDKSEVQVGHFSARNMLNHDYEPTKCPLDCPKAMCQCLCRDITHCHCCSKDCCNPGGVH